MSVIKTKEKESGCLSSVLLCASDDKKMPVRKIYDNRSIFELLGDFIIIILNIIHLRVRS